MHFNVKGGNKLSYTVKFSHHLSELPEAHDIRTRVFIQEQGFVGEFDEIDRVALHVVLFEHDVPVATGRLFPEGTQSMHIGRVAVLPAYRGRGLGAAVIRELESAARTQGYTEVILSAQTRVRGFYEALGYQAFGDCYLDEFCPHIQMKKQL